MLPAVSVTLVAVKNNKRGTTVVSSAMLGALTVSGNAAPVVDRPNTVFGVTELQWGDLPVPVDDRDRHASFAVQAHRAPACVARTVTGEVRWAIIKAPRAGVCPVEGRSGGGFGRTRRTRFRPRGGGCGLGFHH
jgi:hypothetical protein